MFAALNRAMGRPTPGDVDPDLLTDEHYLGGVLGHPRLDADAVFAAGPRGLRTDDAVGWVHDELLPDGRWSIAPAPLLARLAAYVDPEPSTFVLAPRRDMAWSNSVAYGAGARPGVVGVSPDGLDDGTHVTLVTDHGRVTVACAADPTVRTGVVSMTHGHLDANPGDLTSGDDDVDPLTAMPRVSGLEVRVDPPDAEATPGR
jgi:hypothetical protein